MESMNENVIPQIPLTSEYFDDIGTPKNPKDLKIKAGLFPYTTEYESKLSGCKISDIPAIAKSMDKDLMSAFLANLPDGDGPYSSLFLRHLIMMKWMIHYKTKYAFNNWPKFEFKKWSALDVDDCKRIQKFSSAPYSTTSNAWKSLSSGLVSRFSDNLKAHYTDIVKERTSLAEQALRETQLWPDSIPETYESIKIDEDGGDYEACGICTENHIDTTILPCGHRYFCVTCYKKYRVNDPSYKCPLCREPIDAITFMPPPEKRPAEDSGEESDEASGKEPAEDLPSKRKKRKVTIAEKDPEPNSITVFVSEELVE